MKNNIKLISLLLGIMCFLLTVGIYIQIKTVSNSGTAVAKTNEENELRDKVLEMKQKYEEGYAKLSKKEDELDDLIQKATNNDGNASRISKEISKINGILGFTTLKGEGIEITISDGEANENTWNISEYIVHDEDLMQVVNALFNAGAEAISINGERIIGTTAITCVGNVIKVNDEKLGSPYVIKAIGKKAGLYGALTMDGGYLYYLSSYGVKVETEQSDSIVIPKYNGIYDFKYAK